MTSQRWSVGSIVAIEIEKERFCFGLLLDRPYIAFFEGVHNAEYVPSDASLSRAKVLFICCVYKYVITKSIWKKVGQAPNLAKQIAIPPLYTHDKFANKYMKVFKDGMAGWFLQHVKNALAWNLRPHGILIQLRNDYVIRLLEGPINGFKKC